MYWGTNYPVVETGVCTMQEPLFFRIAAIVSWEYYTSWILYRSVLRLPTYIIPEMIVTVQDKVTKHVQSNETYAILQYGLR